MCPDSQYLEADLSTTDPEDDVVPVSATGNIIGVFAMLALCTAIPQLFIASSLCKLADAADRWSHRRSK